ncbi:MAG TPA: CocE/NonD family hydrolase [Mycobacteriales bacterium]|nr:CocE/NonD family hydrolase [Mycobacteriales bacterium]
MTPRRLVAGAATTLLLGGLAVAAPSSASAEPTITSGCIASVPEPKSAAPVDICYTLFQPAGASAARPVPMIMHGHGWGGSRQKTVNGDFQALLDAGYGILSFDQRGFGQSGGRAHTLQADIEAHDVLGLVDLIAAQPWVAKNKGTTDDPVLGAIGGSYGGGYQFLGAFADQLYNGRNRFDALAPEITWNDLKTALAPDEVARSVWLSLLTAVSTQDNDERAQRAFAYGAATGLWADGPAAQALDADMDVYFEKTGPRWHVEQGRRLDIPLLMRQGTSDTLFNLNEAVTNYDTVLTPQARQKSLLIGYNGGHVLPAPSAVPFGTAGSGDPCSEQLGGGWQKLRLAFFAQHLQGDRTAQVPGTGQYHLGTTDAKNCITVDSVAPTTTVELGTVATTAAGGAPQYLEVGSGPMTIAGVPRVDAVVTSAGVHNKAFFALAVGTSPVDAVVVHNNLMPLHEEVPLVGSERSVELAGVAATLAEGQKLYLVVSPVSDQFGSNGSRTPGALVLRNTRVQLPVVDAETPVAPARSARR